MYFLDSLKYLKSMCVCVLKTGILKNNKRKIEKKRRGFLCGVGEIVSPKKKKKRFVGIQYMLADFVFSAATLLCHTHTRTEIY